ncbi:MAG: hypothetical protein ACRCXB_20575 [Aeromonadaceae bacterium]
MSLFQCENCGCCENTALSSQGFVNGMEQYFDWSYAPGLKGMRLCSACGPIRYSSGKPTEYGTWHCRFPRTFLPNGMFVTNHVGNLAHKETGDEDFMRFEIIGGGHVGSSEKKD